MTWAESQRTSYKGYFFFLVLVFIASLSCAFYWGTVDIKGWSLSEFHRFLNPHESDSTFFFIGHLRLLRVFNAAFVGASLAVVGAVLQKIHNNPLADAHILGVSAGGNLGVAASVILGGWVWDGVSTPLSKSTGAFVGCGLGFVLLQLSRRWVGGNRGNPWVLPVLGLLWNAILGSALLLVMTFAQENQTMELYRWMLGNLQSVNGAQLLWLWGAFVVVFAISIAYAPALEIMAFGKEFAKSIGVSSGNVRMGTNVAMAFLVALTCSVAGAVGFVGLVVPHMVQAFAPLRLRQQLVGCALLGASLTLWADVASRTLTPPTELPIGVFTGLFGAPALLILLAQRSRRQWG